MLNGWFRGQRRGGYNKTEEEEEKKNAFTHVLFFFQTVFCITDKRSLKMSPHDWFLGHAAVIFTVGRCLNSDHVGAARACVSASLPVCPYMAFTWSTKTDFFSSTCRGGRDKKKYGLSLKDLCCALLYWSRSLHCRGQTLSFLVRSALNGVKKEKKNRTKRNK